MPAFLYFDYFNHRDEKTPGRRLEITAIAVEEREWFPGPMLYFTGIDHPRKVERSFAAARMSNIRFAYEPDGVEAAIAPGSPGGEGIARLVCADLAVPGFITTTMTGQDVPLTVAYVASLQLALALRAKLRDANTPPQEIAAARAAGQPWPKVIDPIGLGPKFAAAMITLGVKTAADMAALDDDQVRLAKGLGPVSIAKAHDRLTAAGFTPAFTRPKDKAAAKPADDTPYRSDVEGSAS